MGPCLGIRHVGIRIFMGLIKNPVYASLNLNRRRPGGIEESLAVWVW